MTFAGRFYFLMAVVVTAGLVTTAAIADEPPAQPSTGETVEMAPIPEAGPVAEQEVEDPLEDYNRVMSEINRNIRQVVLDPIVDVYQAVLPEVIQEGVSNAASNLSEPLTAVSSLLQGDTENAKTAISRFFVNTTVGIGGINDVATDMGLEQRREDLGQAAGVHGAEAGAHIVLPIIGPSNTRDAAGDVIMFVVSPLPAVAGVATAGAEYSTNQDDINTLTNSALDPYVVERDAYEERRRYLIANDAPPPADAPVIDDSDFDGPNSN